MTSSIKDINKYRGRYLKDLGKKCFAISKIEDDEILKKIKENSKLIRLKISYIYYIIFANRRLRK